MPLPRVLADYVLDYLKQILICGFGQAISSRVVGEEVEQITLYF